MREYLQQDSAFVRVNVFSTQIAVKKGGGIISPEVLSVAILAAGPNIVTKVLQLMGVDVSELLSDMEDLLKAPVGEYGDVKTDEAATKIIESARGICHKMRDPAIGAQHLLLAILEVPGRPKDILRKHSVTLVKFRSAVQDMVSVEDHSPSPSSPKEKISSVEEDQRPKTGGKKGKETQKEILDKHCRNLTLEAADGSLHPIIGRDEEISRVLSTLGRWTKSNAILVGEAGVGKTAIAEGIAQRIVSGTVPSNMKTKSVFALNVTSVLDKTTYRGQFEAKMRAIVEIFSKNPDYILFIDEVHTLLGAGSSVGGIDAANIMKPALAAGAIKCIGATTEDEYKKYIKKDAALERRFQRIFVNEPSKEGTIEILKGLKSSMEAHHCCSISDSAIEGAVDLSGRYVQARSFPDKAIDCLDETCSSFAFKKRDANPSEEPVISYEDVAIVVADQVGIEPEIIRSTDLDKVKEIESFLKDCIKGQDEAINAIAQSLKKAYAGVRDPDKPIGSFLLGGPNGCGKTYLGKKLAEGLFSTSESLITVNLSEFSEKHHQSRLVGSPPGYVGFGDRNELTDKVMRRPYSLILLDGVENAHPEIMKLFQGVLSEGTLTDSEGKEVSFKNTVIVMTTGLNHSGGKSRIGYDDEEEKGEYSRRRSDFVGACRKKFKADLISRIDEFVSMKAFDAKDFASVSDIMLKDLVARVKNSGIKLTFSTPVLGKIAELCRPEKKDNAKAIQRVLQRTIEPAIADAVMSGEGTSCWVKLSVGKAGEIEAQRAPKRASRKPKKEDS
jgi:ATP-dependent Clp protease ATP-binding subunit ClpC